MAFEADRVIVELLARTEQFDGKMTQSAATNDAAMNKIVDSSSKAEKAVTKGSGARVSAVERESKAISRASQIIGTQINGIGSIVSGPKSPFVVIPKQAPAVSSAMKFVSTGASALGGVLGGALVIGAIAAGTALYNLTIGAETTKDKINDLVEKLKENAEQSRLTGIANDIFATTLEGVTAAIRDDEKALDKLNDAHKTAARVALENANKRLITLEGIRAETLALIDNARAQILANKAKFESNPSKGGLEILASQNAASTAELDKLEEKAKRVDRIIAKQSGRIAAALSHRVVELVGQLNDPLEAINKKYDAQIEAARRRAIIERTVETTLAGQVRQLEKQREAALKIERDRQRAANSTDNSNRQSGRQINEADARRIVAGIGGSVTSGARTAEHNKNVGGVANSFHVKGQALDIAKTAGLTLGKIVKAFEKEGVKLIEKLDEGDHFHIAWSKRGSGGQSAETQARRAQAAADALERRQQAYDNELASLQADELQARQALITSAEEIAQLELQSIDISRAKYEDNVKSLVEQRKLRDDEAKELLKLNEERAKLRKELVNRREDERKFRLQEQQAQNAVDLQTATLQNQADILQSQQGLARTQRERRELENRLIQLQFQEERIRLEALISYNERLKLNKNALESERIEAEAAAAIARIRLDSLEQRQAGAEANNERQNAGPLDSYFGNMAEEAGDINEAFEKIAAGGLSTFTDALTDAIVNFTSLKDVARATLQSIVAGLVKLAIQQVILATIGKALGGGATAATAAQATAAATAWAPAAAAASLATLGANAGPAAAALAGTHALSFALSQAGKAGGFKDGGRIFGTGSSTSDKVPLWGSPDEFMIRAKSARTLGYDTLEHINRTGKLPGFAQGGRGARRFPSNIQARSASRSVGIDDNFKRELRAAVADAAATMPGISLYASLDPADMMKRALGTQTGRRALLVALGENSGAAKAALDR